MAKNVVPKKTENLPAEFEEEFLADAEEWEEHLTQDDMAMPFLQILQALSPQVTEGEDKFLEEAEKGMIFNTVSKQLYDGKEGVRIIPVRYKHSFIEWVPRSSGGGFVAEHDKGSKLSIRTERSNSNEDIITADSKIGTPGNQIVETATHYVLLVNDEGVSEPCLLTMYSTQFKVSKTMNSQIQMRTVNTKAGKKRPPRFYDSWILKSVLNKNDQGSWYGFDLTRSDETISLDNGRELYDAAKAFAAAVVSGEKTANYNNVEGITDAETEEVPF